MSENNISKYYVDENVVRIIGAQVIVLSILTLVTGWKFLAFLLAGDFALRAFTYQPSPLAVIAKLIVNLSGLTAKPIFAPPKKFAAGLGFVFSLSVWVLLYLNLWTPAYVVGGILIFCAVLESVFKICLGCYVYNWVVAPIVNKKTRKN